MDKQSGFVVVGGGIAGLSAAYYLQKQAAQSGRPVTVDLYEQDQRLGGKIVTERLDGFVIEGGPDTFVASKPWAVQLCRELGIAERLMGTNPRLKTTYILRGGRLHPLPGGLTMMIPTEIRPMIATRLLSWPGKLRMAMDFFIPRRLVRPDESMGQFVGRRIGREAYENLIEPLMSGIYAGDGDMLSVQATMPFLLELEARHGGLVRGALAMRKARKRDGGPLPGSRSLFLTPRSGLAEMVEALVQELEFAGVKLHAGVGLESIEIQSGPPRLRFTDGSTQQAAGLVMSIPAYAAAELILEHDGVLADLLAGIEYVSTATVSMAFRQDQLSRPLDGYGYVIPRRENRKALACTWTSTKFPHRAPDGHALLRVFIGRAGQEPLHSGDDADLIRVAREEIALTLGIHADPIHTRVHFFERAMPQYNLGHPERLARIEDRLGEVPWLALAGAGYRGIGIPDCVHSGQLAARKLLENTSLAMSGARPGVVLSTIGV